MKRQNVLSGSKNKSYMWAVKTAFIVLSILLASNSMAYGKWAMFKGSSGAKKAFEHFEVNPAYKYYYSGPDAYPIAIMGLKKELKLEPADLWKTVPSTPARLKELVTGTQSYLQQRNYYPWGFEIIDGKGQTIGIWYSLPIATTSIVEKNDGAIVIYTPDIETYMKLENDTQ